MCEDPAHYGWCLAWAGGPELYQHRLNKLWGKKSAMILLQFLLPGSWLSSCPHFLQWRTWKCKPSSFWSWHLSRQQRSTPGPWPKSDSSYRRAAVSAFPLHLLPSWFCLYGILQYFTPSSSKPTGSHGLLGLVFPERLCGWSSICSVSSEGFSLLKLWGNEWQTNFPFSHIRASRNFTLCLMQRS